MNINKSKDGNSLNIALEGRLDTTTAPQQGDPLTFGIRVMTVILLIGFPIVGWICTLMAMKNSELTYEKMEEIQKSIGEKKKAAMGQ